MLRVLLEIGILGLVASTGATVLSLVALARFLRQKPVVGQPFRVPNAPDTDAWAWRAASPRGPAQPTPFFAPPVSLLKPLYGAEPNLEAHLETFFVQDYPNYEVLFCTRSPDDPGLATARRVAARHPNIPARFLFTGDDTWINAKVSSLEVMAAYALHDIFIISDSDVRVTPDYIREVVAPFAVESTGTVTCLYRGVADRGLWSKLEAAGMSVEMTAGVLTASFLEGMKFALGPTMAVRRRCIRKMGGFGVLGPYCSDDFILGARVAAQGSTVVLSRHVIDHIVLNIGFLDSLQHQTRWMRSTRFSRPLGHLGTALTFSMPWGILGFCAALALHQPTLAWSLLAWSILQRIALAAFTGKFAVHEPHLLRTIALYPLRDLLGFFCWLASYAGSTILWRGRRYRLSRGGLMHPIVPTTPDDSESALTA